MDLHPACAAYPAMSESELRELAQTITEQGQLESITVMPDGAILDGRNRWLACELAGVEPKTVMYEGDDPVRFVMAKNHQRRHLTTDEKAFIAARLANLRPGNFKGRILRGLNHQHVTQKEAAQALGVTRQSVQEAQVLLTRAEPHIQDLVLRNEVGLEWAACAVRGASRETQAAWQTGNDVRESRRSKKLSAPLSESLPPKPRRISAWDIARPDGGFRTLSREERGAPPAEIEHEQAPGEPLGVTRLRAHIAKHGHVQLWSPSEKERIDAGIRFTELRGHLLALADPANVPDPDSIQGCLNPRTVLNHHAIWDRTLEAAIANLEAFRETYRQGAAKFNGTKSGTTTGFESGKC